MSKVLISYGRTYNLGNFESERIDVQQDFDDTAPGYNVDKAFEFVRVAVAKFKRAATNARAEGRE